MNYIETSISLSNLKGIDPEIVIAELAECGYESFITEEGYVKSYIPETEFAEATVFNVLGVLKIERSAIVNKLIEHQNWNQQWESDYEPISIDNFCHIRAPFHTETQGFEHELVIIPKMSFGTGHHQTTRLMIQAMRKIEFKERLALDVGSGTGVLSILAKKLGAKSVVAIDIDPNATENCKENVAINQVDQIICKTSDSSAIEGNFDIILANINRNVLLKDISIYANHLNNNGFLLTSGFFESDNDFICIEAHEHALKESFRLEYQQWSCLVFSK
ncbi:MAG TPA: 50S ribosomal protein L11 methyltransferase [Salinivirgaceae bacterium]|nr:50S ribosomal protein L11 methyltransferase [Salinivirgaceae bacterium]